MLTSPQPAVALEAGRVVDGRYRVLRRVAAGGFGDVFECLHVPVGTRVALKVLRPGADPASREASIAAILEEARRVARVRHPNIVAAIDAGRLELDRGPSAYVALEWSTGETLTTWRERAGGKLTLAEAWALVEPLVRAVAHAHDLGIAHRDIKPSNVMVEDTPDGPLPKLLDFGIAKVVERSDGGSGATRTESATTPYTPASAAPERIVRARTGPWTDVHALGLVFVGLVTGEKPYGDEPLAAAVAAARPTPATFGEDVGSFEAVWARALALKPRDRYRDARALHEALVVAAAEHGWKTEPLPSPAATRPDDVEKAPASPAGQEQGQASTNERTGTRSLVPPALSRRALLLTGAIGVVGAVGVVVAVEAMRGPRRLADLDAPTLEARVRAAAAALPFDPDVVSRFEDLRPGYSVVTVFWSTRGTVRLERGDPREPQLERNLREHVEAERAVRPSIRYAIDPDTTLCVAGTLPAEVERVFSDVLAGIVPERRSDRAGGAIDGL